MIRCASRRLAKIVQMQNSHEMQSQNNVVSQVQSINVSLISKKKTNKENHDPNQKNLQKLTRISQAIVDSPVKSDQSKIRKVVGSNQIFAQLFTEKSQNHLDEKFEIDVDREFTDHIEKLKVLHAKYHGLKIDR